MSKLVKLPSGNYAVTENIRGISVVTSGPLCATMLVSYEAGSPVLLNYGDMDEPLDQPEPWKITDGYIDASIKPAHLKQAKEDMEFLAITKAGE